MRSLPASSAHRGNPRPAPRWLWLLLPLMLLPPWGTARLPAAGPGTPTGSVPISDLRAYGKVSKVVANPFPPADTRLTRAEVVAWWRVRALMNGEDPAEANQLFEDIYPAAESRQTFTPLQVKALAEQRVPTDDGPGTPGATVNPPAKPWFSFLHLRRTFTDVLLTEDPTVQKGHKKFDDLKGALLSYTRNLETNQDTWATEAALIGSYVITPDQPTDTRAWATRTYGLIPSVSLHRDTTSGKTPSGVTPKNEVDQLAYRLGVFGKWSTPFHGLETITARGFGTYVTDTGHESRATAGQFEIEPQAFFNWRGSTDEAPAPPSGRYSLAPLDNFAIGYKRGLVFRNSTPEEIGSEADADPAILAYQIRLRLRAEYGEVADAGATGVETGAFLRGGPIVEFTLDPFFSKRLVLSLSYSHLPSLFGPAQHQSLLNASAEWRILNDKENQRILALTAAYTRGGIDVTQQRVETLKLGLSATF